MATLKEDLAAHYDDLYRIALKITKTTADAKDLTQDIYIILLEYDQRKLQVIFDNGHLGFWVTRVMCNQYLNANSKFKRKYYGKLRTDKDNDQHLVNLVDEEYEDDTRIDMINEAMNDLHFYDRSLFKVYTETDHTIRSLAAATGISTTSIFSTLKKVRNKIKDEVKNKY